MKIPKKPADGTCPMCGGDARHDSFTGGYAHEETFDRWTCDACKHSETKDGALSPGNDELHARWKARRQF
ncbi:MAG: hypothetical protein QM831_44930 [Kofleriaceae bacterium]